MMNKFRHMTVILPSTINMYNKIITLIIMFEYSLYIYSVCFMMPAIALDQSHYKCQPSAMFIERGRSCSVESCWFHISSGKRGSVVDVPIQVVS